MEIPPKYGFLDVAWAPVRALSAKQIGVMTVAVIAALVIYNLLTYVAVWADGESVALLYLAYGVFPFEVGALNTLPSQVVYWSGVALAGLLLMVGFCGVAILNIEAMRGNRFMSFREGLRFAGSRSKQIMASEFSILIFVALIVGLFLVLGLVTRIPWVGEWLYALIFFMPNFFVSLFTVFIIFALPVTVLLLPAVAAAERRGEVFGVLLELFSTIIRTPMRWLLYTIYGLVTAKVFSFLYAYFCYRAVQFITVVTSWAGGETPEYLVRAGLSHLPVRTEVLERVTTIFPGVRWSFDVSFVPVLNADRPVAWLMAVMLFLVFASILGYFLAVIAAAQARGYVALRFIKDGYPIAEEPPMFAPKTAAAEPPGERVREEG